MRPWEVSFESADEFPIELPRGGKSPLTLRRTDRQTERQTDGIDTTRESLRGQNEKKNRGKS